MVDPVAAVAELLARWRHTRHPALADALERVSARVARPPVPGATAAARHQAWLALAAAGDPADTRRLLATLLDGPTAAPILERLTAMVDRGPDPRVAGALVELVTAQRRFTTKLPLWRAVLEAIVAMGDPAQIAPLRGATPILEPGRPAPVFRGWLARKLPPVVAALEQVAVAPLASSDRAAADRAVAPTPTTDVEAELLAACLDAPDDDAPRSILADALLARGDPRGELIALQVRRGRDGRPSRREQALVRALEREVLGELTPVVRDPVLIRGFLGRCHAVFPAGMVELADHAAWRTVEELVTDELRLLRRTDLTALRHIGSSRATVPLLTGPFQLPHVRSLGLAFPHLVEHGARLARSAVVPNLRELRVRYGGSQSYPTLPRYLAKLLGGRLGVAVERVVVWSWLDDCPLDLEDWRRLLGAARAERRRLQVRFELPSKAYELDTDDLEARLATAAPADRATPGPGPRPGSPPRSPPR